MEINGEVNIEIDQYADVSIEIDTDDLAETLCQDHNLVDDVRMEEYFRSSVEDMVQDEIAGVRLDVSDNTDAISRLSIDLESATEELNQYELLVKVDDLDGDIDELREKIRGLQPDNNYVRINDLRDVIDAQVDMRLTRILSDVTKGIEEYRKGN
jgi:hypothetical protein